MDLNEIIKEIKQKGITAYKIAEKTSLTEVGINKILNGESKKPRPETLRVLEEYLHNSVVGLHNSKNKNYNKSNNIEDRRGVPYYDVDFTSSFLEIVNNQSIQPDTYIDHPFFKGCDYVVRNSGQSMAKVICHGDAIGLVEIKNWRDFFPFGEIYAIVTKDNLRMIKVITKGENDNYFTLISKPTDNKKDEFPAQQIKKDSILSIFRVQASSHLF